MVSVLIVAFLLLDLFFVFLCCLHCCVLCIAFLLCREVSDRRIAGPSNEQTGVGRGWERGKEGVTEVMTHMLAGLGIPTIPVRTDLTWKKTMSSCQSLGSKRHMGPRQADEQ